MIRTISNRITTASKESPILVTIEKAGDKLMLKPSFASTAKAQRMIQAKAPNIFGVFDRTMLEQFKIKASMWVAKNGM